MTTLKEPCKGIFRGQPQKKSPSIITTGGQDTACLLAKERQVQTLSQIADSLVTQLVL